MANEGTIEFSVWLDANQAEKGLADIKKKIHDLEVELATQRLTKGGLEEKFRQLGAQLDAAKLKLDQLTQAGAPPAAIKEQEAVVKALQKDYDRAGDAVDKQGAAIELTTNKITVQERAYQQLQREALAAGDAGASSASRAGNRIENLSKRMQKLNARISGLAKRVLVFTLITRALRAVRDYMSGALKTSEEFTAATARLRGALRTAFQPIFTAALPPLTALINVLTTAISMLARLTSALFGTTVEASAAAAESLYNESDALDAVGGSGKKAEKSLASFDQINQIGDSSGGGGRGGAASREKQPDFLGAIQGQMGEIETYVAGALLALGAVLAFSGINIPLGIALMAVGALGIASVVAENWGAMPDGIRKALTRLGLILGGAAFAIGAILTFTGHLPLGIGLMIAGAAALGSAAALNWDAVTKALRGPLGKIVALASGALLVLGLVLAFSGAALPLGIALIAAGAAGLATTVAANWDTISTALQGPLGTVVALASGALLALGLVLAFSGAALPLGIALIAAGAAGLATTVAANWDTISTALQGPLGKIVALASGALLVLGLILAFSGVGIPLGLALIAAGAAGLATVSAANWDAVLEKLRGAWEKIKSWWNTNIAPVFTAKWWSNKFSAIGEGMKAAINVVLAAVESGINWVIDKLNSLSFDVPKWVPELGGSRFGINIPKVAVPRLAAGAVIPPNREFMAVLGDQPSGTNIEAPLDTIVAAFRQALREGGGSRTLVLQVDRRELGRIVFDAYNTESGRVGIQIGGLA